MIYVLAILCALAPFVAKKAIRSQKHRVSQRNPNIYLLIKFLHNNYCIGLM
jgi:hypothetical protein